MNEPSGVPASRSGPEIARPGFWSWTDAALDRLARSPRRAAAILLALFAAQAAVSACLDSVTFDETAHLASGYAALDRLDFRINPEHPFLPKAACAFPLWLAEPRDEIYEHPSWRNGRQWPFGYEFLNAARPGGFGAHARLLWGRAPMILIGVLLGVVVFAWARDLWGERGALASLVLYAFSPTLLAHTHLVTTDLPAALGFALCFGSLHRYCRRPELPQGAATAVSIGLALLMKFSMILLVVLVPALLLSWILSPSTPGLDRRRKTLASAALLAGAGLASLACIWTAYGFRYAASSEGAFTLPWPAGDPEPGLLARGISTARRLQILPEAFLYGLSFVFRHSQRVAFLNGSVLTPGSWLYLPEALLLKTTPGALALFGAGIWAWIRKGPAAFERFGILAPMAGYLAASVVFGLTLGHRHLTPLYPLLFVVAGGAASLATPGSRGRAAIAFLFLSHLASSLIAFPRPLSYFNLAAGGSSGGWRRLVDSNIDWGQDLRRLGDWMRRSGVQELHLAYFGTGDPQAEGVNCRKVYRFMDLGPGSESSLPRPGDLFAVSVTLLQGLYVSSPEVSELLRSVRERLTPIDKAGDSIFIYRIPAGAGFERGN